MCAIARCTSDSRFLIAEKTTTAASTAPIPARITKTIGRLIYAPVLARPADADRPPQAEFNRSRSHCDLRRVLRRTGRSRRCLKSLFLSHRPVTSSAKKNLNLRGGALGPRRLSRAPGFDRAGLGAVLKQPTESR